MKIYLAELRYGRENITEFEVEEKAKTYKVISKKDIIGWVILGRTINKEDSRICNSLHEAFFRIEADAKDDLDEKEKEYKAALEKYNIIHEVTSAIRLDPSKLDKVLSELRK